MDLKSVRLANEDVTDRPVEFQGKDRLEVVLSNRPAVLTGRVVLGPGRDGADYRVLLFPADRERWNAVAAQPVGAAEGRTARSSSGAVRPGEYFVALMRAEDMPSPLNAAAGYEQTVEDRPAGHVDWTTSRRRSS